MRKTSIVRSRCEKRYLRCSWPTMVKRPKRSASASLTVQLEACVLRSVSMRTVATLVPESPGVSAALGRILITVVRAMDEGSWGRLKACPNDACRWAFYNHSKNRSGKWCTMEVCGNRMKARTFRQRQASGKGVSHPAQQESR